MSAIAFKLVIDNVSPALQKLADPALLSKATLAAVTPDGRLWYCGLWPADEFAQHWLDIERIEIGPGDGMVAFTLLGGELAVIAKMDDYERHDWRWDDWLKDTRLKAFAKTLKEQETGI